MEEYGTAIFCDIHCEQFCWCIAWIFCERVASRGLWPPRSPEFNPYDSLFVGHAKRKCAWKIRTPDNFKKILGMIFPLFPYSSFDACPETYSHDVRLLRCTPCRMRPTRTVMCLSKLFKTSSLIWSTSLFPMQKIALLRKWADSVT
jgi:hypothetical protein